MHKENSISLQKFNSEILHSRESNEQREGLCELCKYHSR